MILYALVKHDNHMLVYKISLHFQYTIQAGVAAGDIIIVLQ